jgi:hypothetical protein
VGWILANGDTAVGTFIIISGFVIALNVDRSYDGYGGYIIRRALRLFPVYLTCPANFSGGARLFDRCTEGTYPGPAREPQIASST